MKPEIVLSSIESLPVEENFYPRLGDVQNDFCSNAIEIQRLPDQIQMYSALKSELHDLVSYTEINHRETQHVTEFDQAYELAKEQYEWAIVCLEEGIENIKQGEVFDPREFINHLDMAFSFHDMCKVKFSVGADIEVDRDEFTNRLRKNEELDGCLLTIRSLIGAMGGVEEEALSPHRVIMQGSVGSASVQRFSEYEDKQSRYMTGGFRAGYEHVLDYPNIPQGIKNLSFFGALDFNRTLGDLDTYGSRETFYGLSLGSRYRVPLSVNLGLRDNFKFAPFVGVNGTLAVSGGQMNHGLGNEPESVNGIAIGGDFFAGFGIPLSEGYEINVFGSYGCTDTYYGQGVEGHQTCGAGGGVEIRFNEKIFKRNRSTGD